MKLFKKVLAGVAVAAAMATSAHAALNNVGGVIWDPLSASDFTGTSANVVQNMAGDGSLSGYGYITQLNGTNVNTFCPGCELTIKYYGFTSNGGLNYANGTIEVYVDYTPDTANGTSLSAANTADGSLWLKLTGHNLGSFGGSSLFGASAPGSLTGQGYLDVAGGMAGSAFNTNGKFDGADFGFTTGFSAFLSFPDQAINGTVTFNGDSVQVPEPASLALVGLGLLGVVGARRRKGL